MTETKKTITLSVNLSWNIYNFRLNLIRALRGKGYRVVLIAPRDTYTPLLEKEFPWYHIQINNKGTNPLQDLLTWFGFYRLYRKIRPQAALHFTIKPNIYGSLAAKALGIKTVNNITGLGTLFIRQTWATQIAKILYKLACTSADKVFFQNNQDRDFFLQHRLINPTIADILPGSGVDTEKFSPVKRSGKPDKGIFTFLLIARMLWDKGIGEYIEAIKILRTEHPSVRCLLLGPIDSTDKTAIPHQMIKEWEDKGYIIYGGTSDDVRDAIADCDCVLLPSYREGTPRSLLEAASMGKPIIAADTIGCREAVDDGVNGFLCRPQDPRDLALQMEKMMGLSYQERLRMGEKGREKMLREFDEKIVIEKYIQTLDSLLL